MDNTQESRATRRKIRAISAFGFLFTIHAVLPAYIASTFLAEFAGEQVVGIIYTVAAIFAVLVFLAISGIIKKIGNYLTLQIIFVLEFGAFAILATSNNPALITGAFITSLVAGTMIAFHTDVFLEKYTKSDEAGGVRGSFLTLLNLGWIISQLLVSLILTNGDYWKIFSISLIILIPVWLLSFNFRKFQDSPYTITKVKATIREILDNKNVYKIVMSGVIIQFFYAWMIVYTPIYLHNHIGLSWGQTGIIFTIALLPFVLIEAPLGFLADRRYGEKEMLTIGFLIMAISTASIAFITSTNMWVWATVLFITRIGAGMIEIMNETYFFKKTASGDANVLSFFRMTRPIAYIIAPIVASVLLIFLPLSALFPILGLVILYGLRYSLTIEDTR